MANKQVGRQMNWRAGTYTSNQIEEIKAFWNENYSRIFEIAIDKFHKETMERIARGESPKIPVKSG